MPHRNLKVVPLGERQRIRMLALLNEKGPMSAADIGATLHMTSANVLKHTRLMRGETPRRAYIESYVANGTGRPTPLYAAGNKPDTEYTHEIVIQNRHQTLLSRLVMALESAPGTNRELAARLYLSISGTRNLVAELREMKWCRIVGWSPVVNRNSAPIFGLGVGPDKKKATKTRAQLWQEQKKDAEAHERSLAKRRARARIGKVARTKTPASPFAALGL